MSVVEMLPTVRYVTDNNGKTTDVLVSFATWQSLISAWDQLLEKLEEQDDRRVVTEWLALRGSATESSITLDEFEKELIEDGLLPSSD